MLYPYRKKRPPTLTFRVATTFHDPRVINTEYPSTGPCHIGRFKKIDNVMSARPWDSVKAFAVTSIEACLSAKNEATVEKNQNPLFKRYGRWELEGSSLYDSMVLAWWYYTSFAVTSVTLSEIHSWCEEITYDAHISKCNQLSSFPEAGIKWLCLCVS